MAKKNGCYGDSMDVGIAEAKNKLTGLLRAVEQGESIVITRNGKPVAHSRRCPQPSQVRPGTMWGRIKLKPGWDHPITAEQFWQVSFELLSSGKQPSTAGDSYSGTAYSTGSRGRSGRATAPSGHGSERVDVFVDTGAHNLTRRAVGRRQGRSRCLRARYRWSGDSSRNRDFHNAGH